MKETVQLLVLKGLPASGKSSYAKELVAQGWKRVNKDDLRAMIDSKKFSRENEKMIRLAEESLAHRYLSNGFNVVVDDTNFGYENYWRDFAKTFREGYVQIDFKFFDVPVMECIERDAGRGDNSVGGEVILRMYNQHLAHKLPKTKLPSCFIFDIDGTLATMTGRSPYDYTRVSEDAVNTDIAIIFDLLACQRDSAGGYKLFIFSGRQTECREDTLAWLERHGIKHDGLYMRPVSDKRKDSEIKRELFEQHIRDKYNVVAVFDDRNQVVDLWRSLGLTCCQVNYGFF